MTVYALSLAIIMEIEYCNMSFAVKPEGSRFCIQDYGGEK